MRDVAEQATGKLQSCNTMLVHGMGADFHKHMRTASSPFVSAMHSSLRHPVWYV